MKRRKSDDKKAAARKKRGGKRRNLPPIVGTALDIIEEITFAFGTSEAASESDEAPTLKKLNRYDQL